MSWPVNALTICLKCMARECEHTTKRPTVLQPKEQQVLLLLAKGHDRKETARRMGVKVLSLSVLLSTVYEKIGVTGGMKEAAKWAQSHRELLEGVNAGLGRASRPLTAYRPPSE